MGEVEEPDESDKWELIFNLINDRFKSEWNLIDELDTKATSLIGFVGVILSFEGIFAGFFLENISITDNFFKPLYGIFVISVVVLISAMACGLIAFRVQRWPYAPDSVSLLQDYGSNGLFYPNTSKLDILKDMSDVVSSTIKIVKDKNNKKAKFIEIGLILLIIGIAFLMVFIALLIIWR